MSINALIRPVLQPQVVLAPRAEAQERFPIDWFSRKEGLSSSQIHQTALSSDGRLWAATPSGLICYDGVRISAFGSDQGLRCHGLRSLAIDEQDRLWVGSDEGLQRFSLTQDGIEPISWDPIGVVETICVDHGQALIGTTSGLFRHEEDGGAVRSCDGLLTDAAISDICLSESGEIFVVGPELGLAIGRDTEWRFERSSELAKLGTMRRITMDDDGHVLVGGDAGLGVLDTDGVIICTQSLPSAISALSCHEGKILVATTFELCSFQLAKDVLVPTGVVINDINVNHMSFDGFGNIWLSSESNGIGRLNALSKFLSYPVTPDLGAVLCIKRGADGIMFGGTKGLLLSDGTFVLQGTKVWDVHQDDQGIIWVASEAGLQCLTNPSLPMAYHHDCPVLAGPNRVITPIGEDLLVGSTCGLARITGGDVQEINRPDGNTLGYVFSIFVGHDGVVWIATLGSGLWQYDGTILSRVSGGSLPKTCNVYALAQSQNGDVYIAHDNKISKFRTGEHPILFSQTKETIAAWSMVCTDDDRLFAGSTRGLIEFDILSSRMLRRISDTSGDNNWEFTTSRSIFPDQDNIILCGLASGLAKVKTDQFDNLPAKPKAELHQVRWIGVTPKQDGSENIVDEGKWRVEFDIRSCWYVDEANCQMRFRILGFDKGWSKFAPVSTITYSSLPTGIYTLEVEIRSPIAGLGDTAHLYTFEVSRPRPPIVRLFSKMFPAAFGQQGHLANIQQRRLNSKNLELEQMIRERTIKLRTMNEEMRKAHEELNHLANSDPLTEIANRRRFEEKFELELDLLAKEEGDLSIVLLDIDYFKAYNDQYGHLEGDETLRRVAQAIRDELRGPDDLVARIGGEEFAVILPGKSAQDAVETAQYIVDKIASLQIGHSGSSVASVLTVSAGATTYGPENDTRRALMLAADSALYQAKNAGRNQVMHA